MIDYFALLNEPKRPWLDLDLLKSKFFAISAVAHPDRSHLGSDAEKQSANDRYSEINTAYNCLREPKERLLHLLELERGMKPADIERIPAGAMELFMEAVQVCRVVDGFLADKAKVTSPLLKVHTFEQAMGWTDALNTLQQTLHVKKEGLLAELQAMNAHWESAPEADPVDRRSVLPLARLEEIYRAISYISRWTGQIQERVVQLSF